MLNELNDYASNSGPEFNLPREAIIETWLLMDNEIVVLVGIA